MIPFQFAVFWRLLRTRGPMEAADWRAVSHRIRFFILFPIFQIINNSFLTLDALLFRFRDVEVKQPVFVLSPPRSGSTLLQRLLAQDQDRFSSFALWQLIFPSLSTQVPVRALGRTRLGRWLHARLAVLQDRIFARSDRFHRIRLEAAEEDEVLFVHACASELLANAFPIPEIWRDFRLFDQLSDARRHALMGYYRSCVQRHLYLEGPNHTYLSKSPPLCHKVSSIKETFPDARFILLLRHPEECISSVLSMLHAFRSSIGLRARDWKHANQDPEIVRFSVDCYRHALSALDAMPASDYQIVRYDDLVRHPLATVAGIYAAFGIPMRDGYRAILEEKEQQAVGFRSMHRHSIQDFGLTSAEVEALLPEVYQRFGFERR